ncbi:FAD binding-domain-containing protein [Dothistroma septosporum NZE10]|uniref:FAD binding-domain-containing protein n=1 Tax=Dothistroma septosporum (strain NZE10 / CBS 128990) TaxID=675120 RepID=N1PME7_DOTSN|nr:FAD binding-domain-containing protein [Dothistroma septosporum NZE10]
MHRHQPAGCLQSACVHQTLWQLRQQLCNLKVGGIRCSRVLRGLTDMLRRYNVSPVQPQLVPLSAGVLVWKPNSVNTHIMIDYLSNVAIVGAGLGGCALAVALSEKNIPVALYESRPEVTDGIPSGVVLPPNGLRILDRLGIFARIKDRCYVPTASVLKNDQDETTEKVPVGGVERWGYKNHRVWRGILLDEMKLMLKARNVPVHYESRFNGIVSETSEQVTFRINDRNVTASLLFGSDGINSSIRKYLAPGVEPEYTGLTAVLGHIKWSDVDWPYSDYERNATIQGKPGAILWIGEDPAGSEIMIVLQKHTPKHSREELARLQADPDRLAAFYTENYDEYGSTAKKIIDAICKRKDSLFIWPFMKMPRIERWYSETGRIILLGDGAHALPPSSGQGVNQALEDVYFVTLLLSSLNQTAAGVNGTNETATLIQALTFWQQERQKRIDAIFDYTNNYTNVNRMPEAERKQMLAEGKVKVKVKGSDNEDMGWLYQPEIDEKVHAWLESRATS